MSSKTLGTLMYISVTAAAICGLFICVYIVPLLGKDLVTTNPESAGWFWPWLVFSWLIAVPCFAILIFIWKVTGAVVHEAVFTIQTAKWVKCGAILLLADAALFFFGNVVLLLMNMSHPGVLLFSIMADIFAVALALLAAVLSRYLTRAAFLQEESEGTL